MLKKILLTVLLLTPISSFAEEVETWLEKVLRITGILATSSGQKGDNTFKSGELWIVNSSGRNMRKVTNGSNYKSPIFHGKDETIFALRKGYLVKFIRDYGLEKPILLFPLPNILKLIDSQSLDNELLVLDKNGILGILSLSNAQISWQPHSHTDENKKMINYLKAWTRDYNATSLFIASHNKDTIDGEIEWIDIYLKLKKDNPLNLSNCEPRNCTQPSISKDKHSIVFIKESDE